MEPPPDLYGEIVKLTWTGAYKYFQKKFLDYLWESDLGFIVAAICIACAVWYSKTDSFGWCCLFVLVVLMVAKFRQVCVSHNELTWKDPLIGLALSIVYHAIKLGIDWWRFSDKQEDWRITWIDLLMVLFQSFLFCVGQYIRARISMSNSTSRHAEKYQASEASGNGDILDEILDKLSKDLIDRSWREFFRKFKVEESELEEVQINESKNVKEQIYQLLCRLKKSGRLNWTSLIDVLKQMGRKDLAHKYSKEKFSES